MSGQNLGPGGGAAFRAQSASPTLTTAVWTPIQWSTHQYDDGMHNTSGANLTGTVAKTSGASIITGTSTIFLSEVKVGDVLYVPGGAAPELIFVQSVDSDTQITISKSLIPNSGTTTTLRTTATGQTVRRANEMVVIQRAGLYLVAGAGAFAANVTGQRGIILDIAVPGSGGTEQDLFSPSGTVVAAISNSTVMRFASGDGVALSAFQSSGGNLAMVGDSRTSLSIARIGD